MQGLERWTDPFPFFSLQLLLYANTQIERRQTFAEFVIPHLSTVALQNVKTDTLINSSVWKLPLTGRQLHHAFPFESWIRVFNVADRWTCASLRHARQTSRVLSGAFTCQNLRLMEECRGRSFINMNRLLPLCFSIGVCDAHSPPHCHSDACHSGLM